MRRQDEDISPDWRCKERKVEMTSVKHDECATPQGKTRKIEELTDRRLIFVNPELSERA